MTVGEQLRWWGVGLAVMLVLIWLLAAPLLPFILGAAIAYLADPVADRLQRLGLSRLAATATLSVALAALGLIAALVVIPLLVDQVRNLIENAPSYVRGAQEVLSAYVPESQGEASLFARLSARLSERAEDWSIAALQQVWVGGLVAVDYAIVAVVTPVVGFYLLYDWDAILKTIDDLCPRQHQATIRRLALELDDVLAGFIRGQLTVCLILGSFYGVALTIVGLKFGLLVGMFCWADQLHPLRGIHRRGTALGRDCLRAVLGRAPADLRGRGDLRARTGGRGELPHAQTGWRACKASSCVADAGAVGVRHDDGLRGHVDCCSFGGSDRRACALSR